MIGMLISHIRTETRRAGHGDATHRRLRLRPLCGAVFACAALTGVSLTHSSLLYAQQSPARPARTAAPLDLAQAMTLARAHAPALQLVAARQDIAIGRARESVQYPNPTIEYRHENLGSALLPDIFTTLYVPIDITGRRWNLRSAGNAATTRATADGRASRRDAELHIANEWVHAAALSAEVQILSEFAAAITEMARVDSIRFAEGFVSEGIAIRTQLESDRARVALSTAMARSVRAHSMLARTLGVNDNSIGIVAALTSPVLPTAPDSTVALANALQSRPDIIAREAGVREAAYRARAESRGIFGDWQLQGGSKKTSGVMTGQLGLAVPLPVFNRNNGARQRTRGELAEATVLRDDALLGVRAETRAALYAYSAVRSNTERVNSFADRGRELATIARTSYAEGNASLIELLDAERAGVDAQTGRIAWMAEAWIARLELERILGARLDSESPLDLPPMNAALPTSSILR